MRNATARLLAALGLAASLARGAPARIEPLAPDPQAAGLQQAFRRLAQNISPAVVTIHTEPARAQPQEGGSEDPWEQLRRFFGEDAPLPSLPHPQLPPPSGLGSGVIVDPAGYVLTNEHVVGAAERITVTVSQPEAKSYRGKVVGKDEFTDLAVVKIEPDGDLRAATLGDSGEVAPGDWAMAVGSPFGLQRTVTLGVVSAVREHGVRVEDRSYAGFIQTDAAINRGNSGGPLLNIRGEVIGINTAIFAPAGGFVGVGFAIPSNTARDVMKQLIASGRVVRGWLGVEVLPVDPVMAREFRVPEGKGALVNRVLEGSPADEGGLRRGDVILAVEGRGVDGPRELMAEAARLEPGKRASLSVLRDGRRRSVTVTPGQRPSGAAAAGGTPEPEGGEGRRERWEGAALRTTTPGLNARFGLEPSAKGVLVTSVGPGPAAESGLRPGDLIAALNRAPTPDLEAFREAARAVDLDKGVLLDVMRRERRLYLSYRRPR